MQVTRISDTRCEMTITMSELYAFYKQATFGSAEYNQSENFDLRNAFKTNAWMQISHFSIEESKEQYIQIINSLLKK